MGWAVRLALVFAMALAFLTLGMIFYGSLYEVGGASTSLIVGFS